jgi:hypothetical protein
MTGKDDSQYRQLTYQSSRIPALDALSAFVGGEDEDSIVQVAVDRAGFSRWYPENGGHKVLIPYEGGPYDPARFTIEKGAWDHEHCTRCGATIEPMTLCWVSVGGAYVILCESCRQQVVGDGSA